jgi:hypothetical protein
VPRIITHKGRKLESIADFQLGSDKATLRLEGSSQIVKFPYQIVPLEYIFGLPMPNWSRVCGALPGSEFEADVVRAAARTGVGTKAEPEVDSGPTSGAGADAARVGYALDESDTDGTVSYGGAARAACGDDGAGSGTAAGTDRIGSSSKSVPKACAPSGIFSGCKSW